MTRIGENTCGLCGKNFWGEEEENLCGKCKKKLEKDIDDAWDEFDE